jgi:hypothetical protein
VFGQQLPSFVQSFRGHEDANLTQAVYRERQDARIN